MSKLRSCGLTALALLVLTACGGGGGLDGSFGRISQKASPREIVFADLLTFKPDGSCEIERQTRGNGAEVTEKVACTYAKDGNFLRVKVATADGSGREIQGVHMGVLTADRQTITLKDHKFQLGSPSAAPAATPPAAPAATAAEPAASPTA